MKINESALRKLHYAHRLRFRFFPHARHPSPREATRDQMYGYCTHKTQGSTTRAVASTSGRGTTDSSAIAECE